MNQLLQNARWQHSKKKAELISEGTTLIEMEFSRKATYVKIGKQKCEITTDGFWCPKIIITEKNKVITLQKQFGFWGTKSEFILDGQTYTAKTKQGALFNITYTNSTGDVLTYKLDALKSKPIITFEINSVEIPKEHLLVLMALGFYSIRNVAVEALANDFIVSAVA